MFKDSVVSKNKRWVFPHVLGHSETPHPYHIPEKENSTRSTLFDCEQAMGYKTGEREAEIGELS